MAKLKLFNDPLYGLVSFPYEILYDVIDSPEFQRLRRISQMGLSSIVYPGANHTRFQHALGALYLTTTALKVIEDKGAIIDEDEKIATCLAILCHDIGHGPFSHALESSLINIHHELLSVEIMKHLSTSLKYDFTKAIQILEGSYPKLFLHQLISSQLDMDRMDYLSRDSFYTGVAEGVIGYDRIIKMMTVHEGEIVLEEKGVYSVEKFFIARNLMYWQVYLHKTSLAAEMMVLAMLKRVRYLLESGEEIKGSKNLIKLLSGKNDHMLETFLTLDDTDIYMIIKENCDSQDFILKYLCNNIINRRIFNVFLSSEIISPNIISTKKDEILQKMNASPLELDYFLFQGTVSTQIYNDEVDGVKVLMKDGSIKNLTEVAPILVSQNVINKNYLIFVK